jgi:hypothetical protein
MVMPEEIVNKISQSELQTLDLEQFYPEEKIRIFDLKPFLFMELILKEKDFRAALLTVDWSVYANEYVGVFCSAEAVIPVWAYMLVTSYLQPFAREIFMGDESAVVRQMITDRIHKVDAELYRNKRIVVKGCGDKQIGDYAYLEITKRLRPVAKSIFYGEPCSTVPVYKATGLKPKG